VAATKKTKAALAAIRATRETITDCDLERIPERAVHAREAQVRRVF
jgi:catalase